MRFGGSGARFSGIQAKSLFIHWNRVESSLFSRRRADVRLLLHAQRKGTFMQWSKIRTRLKALVCDTLRDRVDFHQTVYRTHHNDVGGVCKCRDAQELWITIDGLQVFRASYCKHAHQLFLMWCAGFSRSEQDQAIKDLPLQEIHSPQDVGTLLRNYLDLDPHISLRSGDPILRALAIIDRRIGLRTLQQLKIKDDEHSLVRMFYALRLPVRPHGKRIASKPPGPKLP